MINFYPKESEWRKWDLHVHSPASDGFSGTWDQFETQLKKAECDVIGINDYFSVAGYKQIKEKIDKGDLNIGGKKILPVVEFRMTESVQNKNTTTNGATHFNFHIIFDDEIKIADIENLIKGLTSNGTKISSDYDDKSKLKDKKVSLDSLLDELHKDIKFNDKFLLWLPYDEYGGIDEIDPKSDKWIKENYIKKADILGSSRQKQIDFFLWKELQADGTEKFTQDEFRGWFLRKKACIKGSDSHSQNYPIGKLKDKDSNPIEKYCWIKAEPTFEGLKQIVYEPDTRIFIGEEKPRKPINTIDSIALKIPADAKVGEDKFCFAGNDDSYNLSPYFNCFIGGRGSGKSTILNFLGLHSNNPDSSKLFWSGDGKDKKGLNPSGFDPSNNAVFSFGGTEIFEFLAQSEIETFARDKVKFTQAIYDRANGPSKILQKFEDDILKYQNDLDKIIEAVFSSQELFAQKKTKEKEKRSLENTKNIIESEDYKKLTDSISELTQKLQVHKKWSNEVYLLKTQLSDTIEFYSKVLEGNNDQIKYKDSFLLAINKANEAIEILEDKNFNEAKKEEKSHQENLVLLEEELKKLLNKGNFSKDNIEQIKSAPQKIVALEREIEQISFQIEGKNKIIATLGDTVTKLKADKESYENKIKEIVDPLQKLLETQYANNKGKDIKKISLEYSFDENRAWNALAKEFYEKFKEAFKDSEKGKYVCDYIADSKNIFSSNKFEDVKNAVKQPQKNDKQYIKFLDEVFKDEKNFQIFQAIRDRHLYDVKSNKIIQVKYDDRDVEQASFGQRCTAVVVILLLFGNYPLIIDEPEAHLDSSLIANYLVPLLKEKKSDRQIIFATHNANFVINGDAEKIFILRNESGQTEVIETTIEDTKNREELLKLEGGKEAFGKRGEKLNIK
jgi:ABC-type lipoprotein export system ATPase subunit